ncbi:gluconate 2-dehydrogenase subunit 3 family protein [Sporosarcina aquimarina]|uniref:Gluconate 2-dehydrogenase subunit 3 family protein n=1 Tax=Sporosarcina aquimarina TaxID=114975 RepID=A0ABU4G0S7_9BACL|nr:gluconate 2-dehydrogenase subunit 3 family protein [Sporosarcina aquimarina]MDW0110569.1 gluconate 2-dehydrogenase subunit 3 family protein [Sporosarcina aquimarina]
MAETQEPKGTKKSGMSRRNFLKNSGLVAGGIVGGGLFGGLIGSQMKKPKEEKKAAKETTNDAEARTFFSRSEDFETLSAAVERLYPEDKIGPGAIGLGVPYFIDRQLASDWGSNAKEYMKGPFPQNQEAAYYENLNTDQNKQGPNSVTQVAAPSPRYQTRMNRGEIFREGIKVLQESAQSNHKKKFFELEGEQMDEILTKMQEGKVRMNGIHSTVFFSLLLKTTIEGAYSDPVYGGNRDMAGWKMVEYPGPRMGYLGQIEDDEFAVMKQESLRDYQEMWG